MKLVSDWRAVLKHAWSIRLILLAALFSGLEVALPIIGDEIPPRLFAMLTLIVVAGAFVARFVAQPKTMGGDDAGQ
ncbi:hypothetical protein SAMN02745157_0712 [Kaistia soli DSM 19436]|uniref:Uncharacterized protein n=1 Tax=Kaistia soli DSM 19436 TaxID=1122133 RepID=A0A1M4VI29_9HYPH|nr:hypothetical protein [Kaistia soli]SHE68686.1 hypothetical protein SAMN02745157_0712 [Kaistia soli DSM 19436]